MKPADHVQCRNIANWILDRKLTIHSKIIIILNDEVHSHLNNFVNKKNRIWGQDNLHAVPEFTIHAEKMTVWCTMYTTTNEAAVNWHTCYFKFKVHNQAKFNKIFTLFVLNTVFWFGTSVINNLELKMENMLTK